MRAVESKDNPLIRHMSRLAGDKKYRRTQDEMVCEGEKLLREALQSGVPVREVVLAREREFDESLLAQAQARGTRLTLAPEKLLRGLSNVDSPQGLVFCCARPMSTLDALRGARRLVLLDGLQDPGNLGTIIRTADAFALDGIILCEGCVDPTSPKVVRATMGAVFRMPIAVSGLRQAADFVHGLGLPLYAAALEPDSVPVTGVQLREAAVIIGNEGHGVTPEALSLCDRSIIIPMAGRAESLNASVAASILMYEMSRG